jgi:PilZ domain
MSASISVRFRIGTHQGEVLDFNRHGITIQLQRPLPVDKPLFVTLRFSGLHPEAIVGTAHNCRFVARGTYRCGIRFRTNSHLQLDRDDVERCLSVVEECLAGVTSAAAT